MQLFNGDRPIVQWVKIASRTIHDDRLSSIFVASNLSCSVVDGNWNLDIWSEIFVRGYFSFYINIKQRELIFLEKKQIQCNDFIVSPLCCASFLIWDCCFKWKFTTETFSGQRDFLLFPYDSLQTKFCFSWKQNSGNISRSDILRSIVQYRFRRQSNL